jgi:hypothetical protein
LASFLSIFNRAERQAALINFSGPSVHLARLQRLNEKPLAIDQLLEFPLADDAGIQSWFQQHLPAENGGRIPAFCGFHPRERIISREPVNVRRLKEPGYLQSLICDHAKLESAENWQINLLHPEAGSLLSPDDTPRAGLLVGMPQSAVRELQPRLLKWGVLPRRLELGTLPLLGGLARHLELNAYPNALVVCEIGQNETRTYFIAKDGVHTPAHLPLGLLSVEESVLKELGAPDLPAARRMLEESSELTRSHGRRLVRVLARHLRPAVDYFEMQTGQRSGALFCAQLPSRLTWLAHALSAAVDLELFLPDFARWLPAVELTVDEPGMLNSSWVQPLSLVAQLAPSTDEHAA